MTIRFDDKVAIVTGAGGGLGREYALALAERGAKVVVNDLGGARDGTGHSDAALKVVEEIKAAGGEAMSNGGSVTEYEQMVEMVAKAKEAWGGVHILINNAGVLRDKSFAKMEPADFKLRRRRPPQRIGQLHQGGVGDDARAGLWPHPDDRVVDRAVRQFRPGQLRRRQARPRRADQDALPRGREVQHQGQHDRPDRGHADDRGPVPGRSVQGLLARQGRARRAVSWSARMRRPTRSSARAPACSRRRIVTLTAGKLLTGDELSPEGVAAHWAEITDRTGEIVPASGSEQSMSIMKKLHGG